MSVITLARGDSCPPHRQTSGQRYPLPSPSSRLTVTVIDGTEDSANNPLLCRFPESWEDRPPLPGHYRANRRSRNQTRCGEIGLNDRGMRPEVPHERNSWRDLDPRVCLERHGRKVYGKERRKLLPPDPPLKWASRKQDRGCQGGLPYARRDRRNSGKRYPKSLSLPGCKPLHPGSRKKLIDNAHNREKVRQPAPSKRQRNRPPQLALISRRHSKPPQLALSNRRRNKPPQLALSNRRRNKPPQLALSSRRHSKPPQLAHSSRQRSKPPQLAHSSRQHNKPLQLVPPPQLVRHPL
jgi:hypothetical protein